MLSVPPIWFLALRLLLIRCYRYVREEGRGGKGRGEEGRGRKEGSGRRGRRKGRRREGEMNANTQVAPRCVLQYVGDCVKIS